MQESRRREGGEGWGKVSIDAAPDNCLFNALWIAFGSVQNTHDSGAFDNGADGSTVLGFVSVNEHYNTDGRCDIRYARPAGICYTVALLARLGCTRSRDRRVPAEKGLGCDNYSSFYRSSRGFLPRGHVSRQSAAQKELCRMFCRRREPAASCLRIRGPVQQHRRNLSLMPGDMSAIP